MYQKRHGRRWFYAVTSLLANLQPKNVHGCTFLGEDGGGFKQQRVLCTKLVVEQCTRMYTAHQAYGRELFERVVFYMLLVR